MATNFPASLDTLTNPTSSDSLSSPSHSAQHANANDAIEALQAKVGADGSAVTSSHDYKIADHASRITTLEGAAGSGLVLVSRTTIGTAVSSVTVSGAFSADYDNYKIVYKVESASANNYLEPTLGSATTGYYRIARPSNYSGGSVIAYVNSNDTKFNDFLSLSTVGGGGFLEIQSPFLADQTFVQALWVNTTGGGDAYGHLNDTTSHTSITFTTNTGTITGGTIDVYGYAKA